MTHRPTDPEPDPAGRMARAVDRQLPPPLRDLLDGSSPAQREGYTLQLATVDQAGWPHVALLSTGEILATSPNHVRVLLWSSTRTTANFVSSGKAALMLVHQATWYTVRLRMDWNQLVEEGRQMAFGTTVDEVVGDVAPYAKLVSGIVFELHRPNEVHERWSRALEMLRELEPPSRDSTTGGIG